MPEIAEVETAKRDLVKETKGAKVLGVWYDWKKMFIAPKADVFVAQIKGKVILDVDRRAKYLLIRLSGGKTWIAHFKMTGHFLISELKPKSGVDVLEFFQQKVEKFVHVVWKLSNGKYLLFSDIRKFGQHWLVDDNKVGALKEIAKLGVEPLGPEFTFEYFKMLAKEKGKMRAKPFLMDQSIIAGLGNIYTDEILFAAKVHPEAKIGALSTARLKQLYEVIRPIVEAAIKNRGASIGEYKDIYNKQGRVQFTLQVYGKKKGICPVCGGPIVHKTVGGRTAHFCPRCQKK